MNFSEFLGKTVYRTIQKHMEELCRPMIWKNSMKQLSLIGCALIEIGFRNSVSVMCFLLY